MKPVRNPRYPMWVIIIELALASCSNAQPEAVTLLKAAEQLADSRPDSAVQLIDSIFYPEKSFNKRDYMRYWVTRVQIRYKNYLPVDPVDEDTLIFKAKNYFTKNFNDPMKTTLACFYSDCVYREQGYKEQATKHYKDAETYAETNQTDSLTYFKNILAREIDTSKDSYLKDAAYFFLSTQAKKHNYDHVFDYQHKDSQVMEKLSRERLQLSVYEAQQKYGYNKQQNWYNHQLMYRQRLIIIFVSFFLLSCLLSLFLLRRIVIQKNRSV